MSLEEVLTSIRRAETRYGREPGSVDLVAVSKVQPLDRIEKALAAGHRRFGENRVQEAAGKWPDLRSRFPEVMLHLVGPLQTNKVKQAVELFDAIETIDREKLAEKISQELENSGRSIELYVQVNTGEEEQKAGVSPAEAGELVKFCRYDKNLPIVGLMAIPPANEPPAPHFALLRKLAEESGLEKLSMGMSGDYEEAISLGATSVRVGSAVFGARVSPDPR